MCIVENKFKVNISRSRLYGNFHNITIFINRGAHLNIRTKIIWKMGLIHAAKTI